MKLNLGCGYKKVPGCVNLDSDPACQPDVVWDLEQTPLPFESDSVDEMKADHVLEHLGQTTTSWIALWKDLWRIAKDGCVMHVRVPHPRHDNFLIDPTHVRPIYAETVALFDQMRNFKDLQSGGAESKLGLATGIDLEVADVGFELCEPWRSQAQSGQLGDAEIRRDLMHLANVCEAIQFKVKFIKPARLNGLSAAGAGAPPIKDSPG